MKILKSLLEVFITPIIRKLGNKECFKILDSIVGFLFPLFLSECYENFLFLFTDSVRKFQEQFPWSVCVCVCVCVCRTVPLKV